MARCGDATCSCVVRGGPGVSVSGGGTPGNAYYISVDQAGQITAVDTKTIDLQLKPPSSEDNPYELSATLTAHLGDLLDVAQGTAPNGYVLAWTGSQWAPVPPATAVPGAIAVGAGITGDGSSGAPVHAVADTVNGIVINPAGIALSPATLQRFTNLETKRFDPNYLRQERSDPLSLTDNAWTRPGSWNLNVTKAVGTRLSASGGYITALDAGVYAWEVTCVWATLVAQTSPPYQACCIEKNDVAQKYGQRTDIMVADDQVSGHRESYFGTIPCNANDKLRPAFYQNNPANSTSSVTPEAFTVYRVA